MCSFLYLETARANDFVEDIDGKGMRCGPGAEASLSTNRWPENPGARPTGRRRSPTACRGTTSHRRRQVTTQRPGDQEDGPTAGETGCRILETATFIHCILRIGVIGGTGISGTRMVAAEACALPIPRNHGLGKKDRHTTTNPPPIQMATHHLGRHRIPSLPLVIRKRTGLSFRQFRSIQFLRFRPRGFRP
jgi:hypothetical protein